MAIVLSMVFTSNAVFAGSGKAIFPHWMGAYSSPSYFRMSYINCSNITDSELTVSIKFYYTNNDTTYTLQDGDDNTTTGAIRASVNTTLTSYDDNPANASVTFKLDGGESTQIYVAPTSLLFGYGTIEWTQDSDNVCGLVASHLHQYKNTTYGKGDTMYLINNGLPF